MPKPPGRPASISFPAKGDSINSTFQRPRETDLFGVDTVVVHKESDGPGYKRGQQFDRHPDKAKYPDHKLYLILPSDDGKVDTWIYTINGELNSQKLTSEFGGAVLDVTTTRAAKGDSTIDQGIEVVHSEINDLSDGTEAKHTEAATPEASLLTLTNGGSGFTSAPSVNFTPAGAAATATIGKAISTVTVTNGGSGYVVPPKIHLVGGGEGAGGAILQAILGSNLSLQVTENGYGYTSAPAVSFAGGGGTGAAATATLGFKVISTSVTARGTGYTSDPLVSVTNENTGTGLEVEAVRGFPIKSIRVDNPGSGYTVAPAVTFSGGDGTTAAQAISFINYALASIGISAAGSGYTTHPTLAITGAGGTGATATARMGVNTVASIVAGGTGYSVNDIISLVGGTDTVVAQLKVTAVSSGVVTTAIVQTVGDYTAMPTGTIAVTGGTGTGATFTLTWKFVGVRIDAGGTGYELPTPLPTVTVSGGGGSGATFNAITATSLGTIKRIILEDGMSNSTPGAGYTQLPSVVLTGTGTGGAASVIPSLSTDAGIVVALRIVDAGSGYATAPTLTITGGAGTGATATCAVDTTGAVVALTLTNAGSGYTRPPNLTIAAPTGGTKKTRKTAKAQALYSPGASVSSVQIISAGTKFTATPTIEFIGGGGTGAAATVALASSGAVIALTLTDPGSYTTAPAVSFTGGSGTGAAATFEIKFWPTLYETHVDDREGIVIDITKEIVPAGTRYSGSGFEEIQALEKWRSIRITSKVNLAYLPKPEEIVGLHNVAFPDLLLSIEVAWNAGYDLVTRAYTGFLSCQASAETRGELIVKRLNGYRGAANALIHRQFFFGIPPQSSVPTVPLIQPSSGTVVLKTWEESHNNAAGTPGGHSYVEQRDSKSVKIQAIDIGNVLTGGIKTATTAVDPSDDFSRPTLHVDINGNLGSVVDKANSLGIITQSVASSLVFSYADAKSSILVNIPDSNPISLTPYSWLLVASEVEKWRFGLYVLTLIYAQVPSLS